MAQIRRQDGANRKVREIARRGAGSLPRPVGVPPTVAGASRPRARTRGQDARAAAGETPAPQRADARAPKGEGKGLTCKKMLKIAVTNSTTPLESIKVSKNELKTNLRQGGYRRIGVSSLAVDAFNWTC